jgi:hypothetical protein
MHSNGEPKFKNKKPGKTLDRRNGELRWRTLEDKSGLRQAVKTIILAKFYSTTNNP